MKFNIKLFIAFGVLGILGFIYSQGIHGQDGFGGPGFFWLPMLFLIPFCWVIINSKHTGDLASLDFGSIIFLNIFISLSLIFYGTSMSHYLNKELMIVLMATVLGYCVGFPIAKLKNKFF